MKKGNTVVIGLVVVIVLGFGVFFLFSDGDSAPNKMEEESLGHEDEAMMDKSKSEGEMMKEEDEVMEGGEAMQNEMMETVFFGDVLAGKVSPLIDFNKADYNKALEEKKVVVLYFYANWCPICKREVADALYPAFNDLNEKDVVGFRVSYNDNETDSDEKGLAKEFSVAYQHTKVFLVNGERVLRSPESWDKGRYLEEINKNI